jgi:hypothetical protein
MANDPPSAEELAEATYLIRRAVASHRRRQTYALSMIETSATLAALQTIDARLALLAQKDAKPVTISGLIWEAAVTACFGFAGSLVARGLASAFNSILSTRLAFAVLPKTELGAWFHKQQKDAIEKRVGSYRQLLKDRYKHSTDPAEIATMLDDYRPLLATEAAELKLFERGFLDQEDLRLLYHEGTYKAVDPLIRAASDVKGVRDTLAGLASGESTGLHDYGDLPTARVLRSALEFFARQRETQARVLDDMDLAVASGRYDGEELGRLALILLPGSEAPADSLTLNLDTWIRFFELCTWITLYPDATTRGHRLNIPKELESYLVRRLFAEYKSSPVGRPFTVLESAVFKTMPQQEAIREFHVLMGSGQRSDERSAERAIERAMPQARIDLVQLWTQVGSDMAEATRKLYPRASAGKVPT